MTVKDLIEELKKYPLDAIVKIRGFDFTDPKNNYKEILPITFIDELNKITLG